MRNVQRIEALLAKKKQNLFLIAAVGKIKNKN